MKYKILLAVMVTTTALQAGAQQTLTLAAAQTAAAEHYPLLRKKLLAAQSEQAQTDVISKAYLPQLSFMAQASYQSAVTTMPYKTPLPGFQVDPLSKDQYRAVIDLSQLIYDGGNTRLAKDMQVWNRKVEEQQVDVQLHNLKEKINQLYLGILFADAQSSQLNIAENDLKSAIAKVEAQVQGGTAFKSSLSVLQAELLKNNQRKMELKGTRKGLLDALAWLTNLRLEANTELTWPTAGEIPPQNITRSELALLNTQDSLLQTQLTMTGARTRPTVSAFAQGGYGRPGLDMLKNDFDPYGIAGVRLRWDISSMYTRKKEEEKITINRKLLEVQRDNFLVQTNSQLAQQAAEIEKWKQIAAADDEIINLRKQVKEAALAQLENGVITSSDYIREVDAEEQARQQAAIHKLQLLQARINYETIAGK
jgi:outer membrane protein TolC